MRYLYRVDKREFRIDDRILPQTDFETKMSEIKHMLEESLEKYRPSSVPKRANSLFLFRDLSSALLFCRLYGGNIYSVIPNHIFFMGDMNYLDLCNNVFKQTDDVLLRDLMAKSYWEEASHTFQPCYEYMVDYAIVKEVVLPTSQNKELENQMSSLKDIEGTAIYKQLICR